MAPPACGTCKKNRCRRSQDRVIAALKASVFSPDGSLLATAGSEGTGSLWDRESGEQLIELKGHIGVVWNISFSPDGKLLATVGSDRTFRLWDLQGNQLQQVRGHNGFEIRSISFSPRWPEIGDRWR